MLLGPNENSITHEERYWARSAGTALYPAPSPERLELLERTCTIIGYRFRNLGLLNSAIDQTGPEGALINQRLEFLGDRMLHTILVRHAAMAVFWPTEETVLQILSSLYSENKALEGRMHERGWDLSLQLFPAPGNNAELADFAEAIIGAAFLDGGGHAAEAVVRTLYGEMLKGSYMHNLFSKGEFKEQTPEAIKLVMTRADSFNEDVIRINTYEKIVFKFCEVKNWEELTQRALDFNLLCRSMLAALCKEIPNKYCNRLALASVGKAALTTRIFARVWNTIGGLGIPFQEARTRLLSVVEDRELLKAVAKTYDVCDLSFDSRPRSSDGIYLALIGASLMGGIPWIVEREADDIMMAAFGPSGT